MCQTVTDLKQCIGDLDTKFSSRLESVESEVTRNVSQITQTNDRVNNIEDSVRIVNSQMHTTKSELCGKILDVEEKCNSNLTDVIKEHTDNCNVLNNKIENVSKSNSELKLETQSTVLELQQKLTQIQEGLDTKTLISPSFASLSGVPVRSFPGDKKFHPVDFIQHCQDSFLPGMSDTAKIKFVKRFLEGEALSWANQLNSNINTYSEFETSFLNKFWSSAEQSRIKTDFLNGPMYRDHMGDMKEFCTEQLKKLVHLTEPLDVITQIDALRRRLPNWIQKGLSYGPTDSVEKFLSFLGQINSYEERKSNLNQGSDRINWGMSSNKHKQFMPKYNQNCNPQLISNFVPTYNPYVTPPFVQTYNPGYNQNFAPPFNANHNFQHKGNGYKQDYNKNQGKRNFYNHNSKQWEKGNEQGGQEN